MSTWRKQFKKWLRRRDFVEVHPQLLQDALDEIQQADDALKTANEVIKAAFFAIGGEPNFQWHLNNPHLGHRDCPMCRLWSSKELKHMRQIAVETDDDRSQIAAA